MPSAWNLFIRDYAQANPGLGKDLVKQASIAYKEAKANGQIAVQTKTPSPVSSEPETEQEVLKSSSEEDEKMHVEIKPIVAEVPKPKRKYVRKAKVTTSDE